MGHRRDCASSAGDIMRSCEHRSRTSRARSPIFPTRNRKSPIADGPRRHGCAGSLAYRRSEAAALSWVNPNAAALDRPELANALASTSMFEGSPYLLAIAERMVPTTSQAFGERRQDASPSSGSPTIGDQRFSAMFQRCDSGTENRCLRDGTHPTAATPSIAARQGTSAPREKASGAACCIQYIWRA